MKLKYTLFLLTLMFLLSSCNLLNILPRADINLSLINDFDETPDFTNTQIKVFTSVDEEGNVGFAIQPVRFQASARPGSIGVDITGFTVEYFLGDGTRITTGSGQSLKGSLTMRVPAGLKCPDITNDGSGGTTGNCSVNTPDVQFVNGDRAVSGSFYAIDIDVISRLWGIGQERTQAFASIVIDGSDSNGNAFSKQLTPITIIFLAGE